MLKNINIVNFVLIVIKLFISLLSFVLLKINSKIILFNINVYNLIFLIFYNKIIPIYSEQKIFSKNIILSLNLFYLFKIIFDLLINIKKKLNIDKKYNTFYKNFLGYFIFFDTLLILFKLISVNLIYANIFDIIEINPVVLFIDNLFYTIISVISLFFLGWEISCSKFNNLNILFIFRLYILYIKKIFKFILIIILYSLRLFIKFLLKYFNINIFVNRRLIIIYRSRIYKKKWKKIK